MTPYEEFKQKSASIAKDIDQSTDWAGMQKFGYALRPSVLPTAGAAALTPLLGPWAGPVVGGVAGEIGNNIMGWTEPSPLGYAVQGLVPPSLRAGSNVKRLFGPLRGEGPGFGTSGRSAETLHQIGIHDLKAIGKQYQPPTPSSNLFEQVGSEHVPMPQSKLAADDVLQRIENQSPRDRYLYKHSEDSAKDVGDLFKESRTIQPESELYPEELGRYTVNVRPGAGGLPALKFQDRMRTLGERLRAARRGEENVGGSANVRNYSELFKGYAKDLDESPILQRARESYKRESTLEDIEGAAKVKTLAGHGTDQQIRVNTLMDRLRDQEDELGMFFHQAFTEGEKSAIINRLGKINELPGLGPGVGQATGSSKINPLLAAMGGVFGAGTMHGGVGEGALAAAGAYALSGAGRMARDLSIAWNIPAGRAMIQQMLTRYAPNGVLSPQHREQIRAAIEAFAAAQTANMVRPDKPVILEPRP